MSGVLEELNLRKVRERLRLEEERERRGYGDVREGLENLVAEYGLLTTVRSLLELTDEHLARAK